MKKILVIEDDSSIRRLIKYDLKNSGFLVEEALDGHEGLEKYQINKPDLIIVDYMMPRMNGLEFVKELRHKDLHIPIIMVTAVTNEIALVESFDEGIDDYITKPFSPRELVARINRHINRSKYLNLEKTGDNIITYKNVVIDKNKFTVYEDNHLINLALKEFELFMYLFENRGVVLSRDQILSNIWGYNYDGDTRIVDVHVFKLRDKFKSEIIKTKRGIGYLIE